MKNKLCYIRTQKKLSLTAVSRMYERTYGKKLSANMLSQIESDERTPSLDVFLHLAELFDVTLDYMLDRTDAPEEELRMYEKGFRQE